MYPVHGNWSDFLRNSSNKEERFQFLLADVCVEVLGRHVETISTKGVDTVSSSDVGTKLKYCSHEEAHTRVLQFCCMLQMLSEMIISPTNWPWTLIDVHTELFLITSFQTNKAVLSQGNRPARDAAYIIYPIRIPPAEKFRDALLGAEQWFFDTR